MRLRNSGPPHSSLQYNKLNLNVNCEILVRVRTWIPGSLMLNGSSQVNKLNSKIQTLDIKAMTIIKLVTIAI